MENIKRPSLAKRAVAISFDFLIIALAASLLSFVFGDVYSRMGIWGSLIGTIFSILYFGILNSSIGQGQTIGKRMLNLRVTQYNGTYLSFHQAAARFSIHWLFFINLHLITRIPGGYFIIAASIGLFLATLMIMLFNKEITGLHDMICDTIVVNSKEQEQTASKPITTFNLGEKMITTFMVVLCVGFTFFQMNTQDNEQHSQIASTLSIFKEVKEVEKVSNNPTTNVIYISDTTKPLRSHTLEVDVWIDDRTFALLPDSEFYRKYYVAIKPHIPKETERVIFTFSAGYDIGIAKKFTSINTIQQVR